jgi:hypothetical protein
MGILFNLIHDPARSDIGKFVEDLGEDWKELQIL